MQFVKAKVVGLFFDAVTKMNACKDRTEGREVPTVLQSLKLTANSKNRFLWWTFPRYVYIFSTFLKNQQEMGNKSVARMYHMRL